jgi:hypothetical protein
MRPSLRLALIASFLVCTLTGCPPERGDDDDDDEESPFGALDRDGDGDLDADDVDAGEAAASFVLDFVDEDGEADVTEEQLTTTTVALSRTTVAWSLDATFGTGADAVNLALRFELNGELEVGSWDVSTGSANGGGEMGWWGYSDDAGGQVAITSVGDYEASGHFIGQAEIDVYGPYEEPTGETVRIDGFAFREVAVYGLSD